MEKAIGRLERKGVEADGRVVATRAGAKRIVREARRLDCDAIVMAADPIRNPLIRSFIWSPGAVARAAAGARAGPPRGRPDGLTSPAEIAAFLARHPPFADLDADVLADVAAAAAVRAVGRRRRRARRGRRAVRRALRRGAPGAMDLVHAGTLVDVLEPGQCFGHPSLLTGLAPAFTVHAGEAATTVRPAARGRAARVRPAGGR